MLTLLTLDCELLQLIFDFARNDRVVSDDRTRALTRMSGVCRRLRALALATTRRVLRVPILSPIMHLGDALSVRPAVGRPWAIHLVCEVPATACNVARAFRDCVRQLVALGAETRVTRLHLALCSPTVHHMEDVPCSLAKDLRLAFERLSGVRHVRVCLDSSVEVPWTPVLVERRASPGAYWPMIGRALGGLPSPELHTTLSVVNPGDDDFVLVFLCNHTMLKGAGRLYLHRENGNGSRWSGVMRRGVLGLPLTEPQQRVVVLEDYGGWSAFDSRLSVTNVLSMLSIARLEFAGRRTFAPNLHHAFDDLPPNFAERMTPLSVNARFIDEPPRWLLRVASAQ